MINAPKIIVLYGGVGSEREVSLVSGAAIAKSLGARFEVEAIVIESESLPASLQSDAHVVFPALHGRFGEDGQLQSLLEGCGIHYCGSDAVASRLCMDKVATKAIARDLHIAVPKSVTFEGDTAPLADVVIEQLGSSLVIKPADQGSSVGLHFTEHRSALGVALSSIHRGNWLIERRIRGREITVGILKGAAMGVVEIVSHSGVYDYKAKYTPGSTEYRFPAELEPAVEAKVREQAERLFDACGCRDFARVDFLLEGARPYFLEINTLPGLTATSLLPKSASCVGLDFDQLAAELVEPAIARFQQSASKEAAR
jgi:D-alanine-D-alanine ligase